VGRSEEGLCSDAGDIRGIHHEGVVCLLDRFDFLGIERKNFHIKNPALAK
jgi:hypothetical protein